MHNGESTCQAPLLQGFHQFNPYAIKCIILIHVLLNGLVTGFAPVNILRNKKKKKKIQ